ncbi:MAG: cell wall hydrolase [Pseudomonadota bacterium]
MIEAPTLSRPFDGLQRTAASVRARAAALWRTYPRETIGAGVFGLVASIAIGTAATGPGFGNRAEAAPPGPPPLIMRQLPVEQALKLNAELPVVAGANPAATPFKFKGNSTARAQALNCLASAAYYEAGNQDADGERAVAQVVLNRVRHPAFPASVCAVVYQGSTRTTGCQFTFTCDGSLYRQPDSDGWRRAWKIAEAALSGTVYAPVGWATHYHANYVVPYWAATLTKSAVVGAHLFYRWAGGWGQPAIFTKAYSGSEPNALALRNAALAVPHVSPIPAQQGQVAEAIKDIPGAEALKFAPSMRGDNRVAVRFNLAAREAADHATHEDYRSKFEVSNNLKWTLSSETMASDEKPLGRPASGAAETAGSAPASAQH